MRILFIEDEVKITDALQELCKIQNIDCDVANDGEEGLLFALNPIYDVIVLDIMLPMKSGLEILKEVRDRDITTPVLMLTAKGTVDDKVKGLDLGADDYLIKPFAMDELLARLRVMLRREANSTDHSYHIADLTVDCNSHRVCRGNVEITLSSKEFSILEYLIRNQGIVLSREKIEQNIWNFDYMGGSNVVDVYIRYLRKKIDEHFEPKLIHTVRGVGYVLKE